MVKDDSVYQVLLRYDFDLHRGNNSYAEYIANHLSQYYEDIKIATENPNPFLEDEFICLLKDKLSLLQEICSRVKDIIYAFDGGHIQKAYDSGCALFDDLKPYLLSRYSFSGNGGSFYRIRSGDYRIKESGQSKSKKSELFHIKKELKERIGAFRYSVAGQPCLYLASDIELAWFECGMPKQFSYCQMAIKEEGDCALKLIDFSNRPVDLLSSVTCWILNARRQDKSKEELGKIYNYLINYILTYPLAAACSVKVKNRGCKFVEEYSFPQLFMYWIRESTDIDGVRYKSSLNSTLVNGMGAVNVALPVKKYRDDGLDEQLTSKIGISDIGYLDVNKDFERFKGVLAEIAEFKNKLRLYIVESSFAGSYVMELIDFCDCIAKTYNALMDGDYQNSELIFTYLDLLYDHAELLYKSRKEKAQDCIKEAPAHKKEDVSPENIEAHYEELYSLANKILNKHAVFNFSFDGLSNFEHI